MRPGIFVSFEGLDGAGKTTQIERLAKFLRDRGRNPHVVREPGGTPLGEQVREMLLHGDVVVPWAEASLFAAARAQLVELEIRPSLEAGKDVICDRYIDSSVAYQGWGRELDPDAITEWNRLVTGELTPDKTFLLAIPAEDDAGRHIQLSLLGDSVPGMSRRPPSSDRLERESVVFRRRIEEAYRMIARAAPGRVVTIDARKRRTDIAKDVQRQVSELLRDRDRFDREGRALAMRTIA